MTDDDDELTAQIEEWTADPINRSLDALWNSAVGSQAEDYVAEDGTVGPISEDGYIRRKTRALREARAELERLLGGEQ